MTAVAGRPLRFALVGYGGSGRGIHTRLVREAGHEVSDVVVRNPERRAQAEADWPGIRLHQGLESLLAASGCYDAVIIASPNALHLEHTARVSQSGVPIILDKPVATDTPSAREVVAAAQREGAPLTVFQNRRWDSEQLTLQQVLRSGALGEVHTFERRWERWRPQPKDRWKENDPTGGGLLLDLGPHLVDSATMLFGPVREVYAEMRRLTTPTEDDVFFTLRHAPREGSSVAVTSRLWAGSVVGAPGPRTRVLGREGAYVVTTFENDASPFEVMDEGTPAGSEGWLAHGRDRTPVPRAAGGHADFYRQVAAWVRGEGPAPVDPKDSVRVAEVLDAARTSAREGRRVQL